MIPLQLAIQQMEQYIFAMQGIRIRINYPKTEQEMELFLKMYNYIA